MQIVLFKILQLRDFKEDYLHQSLNIGVQVRPEKLQDFEKFIRQLDFSISQQNKYIVLLIQHVEAQKEIWLKLNNKVKAYEKWIEKICNEERVIEGRNEQKILDAFVTNQRYTNRDKI